MKPSANLAALALPALQTRNLRSTAWPSHGQVGRHASRLARQIRLLCIGSLLGVALGGQCWGAVYTPILDQSYAVVPGTRAYVVGLVTNPSPAQVEQAQTFTVGQSGLLTGLNVQVANFDLTPGYTTSDLVVSLRTTTGGVPASTILATVNVPPSAVPADNYASQPLWVGVDLSQAGIQVSAGQMLAIVVGSSAVSDADKGYGWFAGTNAGDYPAGSAWGRVLGRYSWMQDAFDFGFQDFVMPVPEPGIGALVVLGLAAALSRRRRRWT